MKPHYFDQSHADPDDHLLERYVEQKVVPLSCLLGGSMIQLAVEVGRDPCETCPGPRRRCKGRPRRDKGDYLIHEEAKALASESAEDSCLAQVKAGRMLAKILREGLPS